MDERTKPMDNEEFAGNGAGTPDDANGAGAAGNTGARPAGNAGGQQGVPYGYAPQGAGYQYGYYPQQARHVYVRRAIGPRPGGTAMPMQGAMYGQPAVRYIPVRRMPVQGYPMGMPQQQMPQQTPQQQWAGGSAQAVPPTRIPDASGAFFGEGEYKVPAQPKKSPLGWLSRMSKQSKVAATLTASVLAIAAGIALMPSSGISSAKQRTQEQPKQASVESSDKGIPDPVEDAVPVHDIVASAWEAEGTVYATVSPEQAGAIAVGDRAEIADEAGGGSWSTVVAAVEPTTPDALQFELVCETLDSIGGEGTSIDLTNREGELVNKAVVSYSAEQTEDDKIHVMCFPSSQDGIIIESHGKFGIIDCGDDAYYPTEEDTYIRNGEIYPYLHTGQSGHDWSYPACDQQMVDYLHAIGANSENVEFFIGTHPHDDHIGAAWRIISEFTPDRVYTPVYDDSFIDKYHQNRLWDNQYVYDQLVQAAHDTGAVLIQHIKEGAPVIPGEDGYASPTFALGDAQITIFNWVEDYQHAGSVPDANRFSFGVRVDVNGRRAWLAGDIDDMVDTETGAQYGADSGFEEGNRWGETEHNEYLGDEMNIVNGIGDVDIMKLGHHGFGGSNVPAYLKSLSPSVCFVTGAPWNLREYTSTTLSELGSYMYVMSDARDRGMTAFCLGIGEDGAMTVNDPQPYPTLSFQSPGSLPKATVGTLPAKIYGTRSNNGVMYAFNDSSTPVVSSWKKIGGSWYYAGDNGVLATGWCDSIEEGTWYWFDDLGRMSVDSWVSSGGSKYYMGKDGRMQKNTVIDDGESTYYVGGDGKMVTDTEIEVDGKTMSFGGDGRLIEA